MHLPTLHLPIFHLPTLHLPTYIALTYITLTYIVLTYITPTYVTTFFGKHFSPLLQDVKYNTKYYKSSRYGLSTTISTHIYYYILLTNVLKDVLLRSMVRYVSWYIELTYISFTHIPIFLKNPIYSTSFTRS